LIPRTLRSMCEWQFGGGRHSEGREMAEVAFMGRSE
jgi:hypothetical protein